MARGDGTPGYRDRVRSDERDRNPNPRAGPRVIPRPEKPEMPKNIFGETMGLFSDPGNKVGGLLNKKLGPANDPISGIIQGLAFNNPRVKGSDKFDIGLPEFKNTNLYPGANMGSDRSTALDGFLPKESNFLRSFIYSLMQRNMQGRR